MDKDYEKKLRKAYQEMIKHCHGHYDESYIKELKTVKPQKTLSEFLK